MTTHQKASQKALVLLGYKGLMSLCRLMIEFLQVACVLPDQDMLQTRAATIASYN